MRNTLTNRFNLPYYFHSRSEWRGDPKGGETQACPQIGKVDADGMRTYDHRTRCRHQVRKFAQSHGFGFSKAGDLYGFHCFSLQAFQVAAPAWYALPRSIIPL